MLSDDQIGRIVAEVSAACEGLGLDFFVVGAFAQAPWYDRGGQPFRGTNDVDFAVSVPDGSTYVALRQALITERGYRARKDNELSLKTASGYVVDLLPFSSLEDHDSDWTPLQAITVERFEGLAEIARSQLVQYAVAGTSFQAASISGIVLLKLIAFDDRPERRSRDLEDIYHIITHFPYIDNDLVYEGYALLEVEDLAYEDVACMVLGREISRMVRPNTALTDRVRAILAVDGVPSDKLVRRFALIDPERDYDLQFRRLQLLLTGFDAGSAS